VLNVGEHFRHDDDLKTLKCKDLVVGRHTNQDAVKVTFEPVTKPAMRMVFDLQTDFCAGRSA
jgi:hypothetical protein